MTSKSEVVAVISALIESETQKILSCELELAQFDPHLVPDEGMVAMILKMTVAKARKQALDHILEMVKAIEPEMSFSPDRLPKGVSVEELETLVVVISQARDRWAVPGSNEMIEVPRDLMIQLADNFLAFTHEVLGWNEKPA